MSVAAALPDLTAEEAAHSERLAQRIHAAVAAAGGWIGFDRYMEMALYEPGLGYYSAGARKFGAGGDFVTAPEVAPVFSRCLAVQCAEVLGRLRGGAVLELGAGSGAMAAAMLAEFEAQRCLPERYFILDVSAELRERQREALARSVPQHLDRVEWLDRLPSGFEGVVVANEVLDALPVQRFVCHGSRIDALGVALQFGHLELAEARAPKALRARVEEIRRQSGADWPDGYASEVNTRLAPWLASLGAALDRGVILFVDYGLPRRELYTAERMQGTLLCHFRHRFHDDPLARPGLQDITAWVDFTAVAEAAEQAGLEVVGYTTQAHFLIGNDLARYLSDVSGVDLVQRVNLSRQAMLLTLPGEMGERFKVIALAKGATGPLRGFAERDLRHLL
jgi:SAM-dependent MidA family methyltransferase